VRSTLYTRQLALAGAALLAVLAVLALNARRERAAALPPPQGSYSALAGPTAAVGAGNTATACGVRVGADTQGIVNPVLPCGIRLYVSYRGRTALASVIGHAPVPAGREFGLTSALARRLGLAGVARVGWSYAGAG
jgi:hypothetical protein